MYRAHARKIYLCCLLCILVSLSYPGNTLAQSTSTRVVNIPYLGSDSSHVTSFEPTIFWFGKVTPTNNYAIVRAWYYDDYVKIVVHIIDRLLWFDTSPSSSDLTSFDAVSLYLSLDGSNATTPTVNSFLFQKPLSNQGVTYKGTGSGWSQSRVPFTATDSWRGNSPNDTVDDKGWEADFIVPFSSLGITSKPPDGSVWKIGLIVHDRDDAGGTLIPQQVWPETFDGNKPQGWATLHFGRPSFTQPTVSSTQTVTIRQGFNGQIVPDAHVGGHTTCGDGIDHWTQWGEANYTGYTQINIQNQWDISDYPCFSRYYVTFPLSSLPPNKTIVSGTVSLNRFGNAGYNPGDAKPSSINALTITDDWNEQTISWNNSPLAQEDISVSWVYPVDETHPAGEYAWDVSRAAAEAYRNGQPLRLAFFSTDGDYHSGKYFWTSDSNDWNGTVRPSLTVTFGDIVSTPTPSVITGDIDNNGHVNLQDLAILLSSFGKNVTPGHNGDVDGNGAVNLSDLSALLSNFGK